MLFIRRAMENAHFKTISGFLRHCALKKAKEMKARFSKIVVVS